MEWLNPIEWLAWVYGRIFQGHAIVGGIVVVGAFGLLGFVLWVRAVDKYNEEHPTKVTPAAPASNSVAPIPSAVTEKTDGKGSGTNHKASLKARANHPAQSSAPTPPTKIDTINQGPGSALSINQQGGLTAGTVNTYSGLPARRIEPAQKEQLVKFLSQGHGIVLISVISANQEADRFAADWVDALTSANWDVRRGNSYFMPIGGSPQSGILLYIGGHRSDSPFKVVRPDPRWFIAWAMGCMKVKYDKDRRPDLEGNEMRMEFYPQPLEPAEQVTADNLGRCLSGN